MLRRWPTLALLATVLVAGCTDAAAPTDPDPDPGPPSGPPEAPAPTASNTTVGPMQEIELGGLAAGRTDLWADITDVGAGDPAQPGPYQLPIALTPDGRYRLLIPLHPTAIADGGPVEVRVRGDGLVTAPLRLTLAPLPPAPGAFAASLDSLQLVVDLTLEREGLTRADVLAPDAKDVLPARLLPLSIVQTLLDDPSHDRDLRDLIRGAPSFEPLVGPGPIDLDLIDRLAAASGLLAHWSPMLDTMRAAQEEQSSPAVPVGSDATPQRESLFGTTDAWDLDWAMRTAAEAKRYLNPTRNSTRIRERSGMGFGAAGLVGGPVGRIAVVGLGANLYLYNVAMEMQAGVLPSEFVEESLTFTADPTRFEEDHPGPGKYYDIKVSARSEGMVLDKLVLEAVIQAVSAFRVGEAVFANNPGTLNLLINVSKFFAGVAVKRMPDADGILKIPSQTWEDIPLYGPRWTTLRVKGEAIAPGDPPFYMPVKAGEAVLTVETKVSDFGGVKPATAHDTIEVAPIRIEVQVGESTAAPGELVPLQAIVTNALDTGLDWDLSDGATWVQAPIETSHGIWAGSIRLPGSLQQFPVWVTATSTATGGPRGAPDAPVRQSSVTIQSGAIMVEPRSHRLPPGKSITFTAIVLGLDDRRVTWSATDPAGQPVAIGSDGTFIAPANPGAYVVTARSVAVPDVEGHAVVTVEGICSWTLEIDGNVWSGDSVTHGLPGATQPSAPFVMMFAFEPGDGPIGIVQGDDGPGPSDASGVWGDLVFGFFPTPGVVWGSGDDDSATMTVHSNDGDIMVGEVSGVATQAPSSVRAPFHLTFRSAKVVGTSSRCGS